ncbi:hypothetical protein A3715_07325 [Oleiphilus sp. HI0009]|uniref:hypothetical protein n=1 Tax=unclassified Oleiphilus TaxID=2631174 RepID=UPI0007C2454E|nr:MULTISPECIES: hypothetical protein [unclassified Oleiphilus]KZX81338.1 hypothetical protein A3715_07325 [Oleiphilus sp. HI0009]KZY70794.1 hypothetical protein A3739_05950 [Oleiphilus sp. HI0067]KZY72205.1 hypothetical protein A3738_14310 [Oleiphilus sp. HI0066]
MGQAANEAVFFMKNNSVSRQMLFSEFEALLDGLSSIPEYVDEDAHAVYTVIDGYGDIDALVFFKIYFDEESHADTSWNLPVEKLASISGSGPDLGGGPIRLACRSQCSINWHQEDLWDPDMNPGTNDFLAVRKAVNTNRLRFRFQEKPEGEPVGIPTLGASDNEDDLPVLGGSDQSSTAIDADADKRVKLARILKEQRLRIRTLEKHKERSNSEIDREQRIIVHAYKNEIQSLKQNLEQLKVSNERLQEKLSSRNEQYIDLQDKVSGQTQVVEELQEKLKNASSEEKDALEKQKLEAEIVLLREQLDRRDLDLAYRDEREDLLRAELEELKETMSDGLGSNDLVEKLKEMEVVYVAYHAGVGHISMTSIDILRYAENPMAFVAEKAKVSEKVYRAWLAHFESPLCQEPHDDGTLCHNKVRVCDNPTDFEVGISDRCDLHRMDI